jgi:hypothetical protein
LPGRKVVSFWNQIQWIPVDAVGLLDLVLVQNSGLHLEVVKVVDLLVWRFRCLLQLPGRKVVPPALSPVYLPDRILSPGHPPCPEIVGSEASEEEG